MITIKVNNNWAHINASKEIIQVLDNELSPYVPNAFWIQKQHERHFRYNEKCVLCRNSGWDLRKHFVSRNGRFPAGLLNRVIRILSNYCGINDVVVEDHRIKPVGEPWEHKVTLREDQRALADAFLRGERGCIEAATAFGKTIVNVVLAAELGVQTLVITPTRELAAQYADRFLEHGGIKSSVWKGSPPWEMGIINIATQQILYRHLSYLDNLNIPFLIVDEAHHAVSKTWYKTIMEIKSYYRLGQSATLPLDDDWGLLHIEACIGPLLGKVSAKQLGNRLAAIKAFIVNVDNDNWFGARSYIDEYRRNLVYSDKRNSYIESLIRAIVKAGLRAMVLCAWGEHVENLFARCVDLYPKVDWVIASIDSDKKVHEKKHALDKGTTQVIIATTVFDEGVDVPDLDVIIMAGGGMAEGRTKQRIGRVRRLGRTGKGAIIDFHDSHYMSKHSKVRKAIYIEDGCEVINCGQAPPDSVVKLVVDWVNNRG